MLKYSFIEHPLLNTLKTLDQLIPNVKQAYALYATVDKKVKLISFENKQFLSTQNKTHLIQKFRKEKIKSNWIRPDMVSFIYGNTQKKVKQLSLTDENNNTILCLKFLSPYDYLYDVLLIELSQENIYQIAKQGKELTTEQKKVIEVILYNSIKARIENEHLNLKTHELIVNSFKQKQIEIHKTVEKKERITKNYEQALDYFLQSIVDKYKNNEQINISFSPTCKTHIYNLNASLDAINKAIEQGINLIQNLSITPNSDIVLEPEDIILSNETRKEPLVINKKEKHSNIIEILDKYEEAAIKANELGYKINGSTVAKLCTPSVTPAAITFNLKKYATIINSLVEKYDTNWTTIKTHFKPLKNILENKKNKAQNVKSA